MGIERGQHNAPADSTVLKGTMGSYSEQGARVAAGKLGLSFAEWCAKRADGLKWCSRHKDWHPVGDFPADLSRGDGLRPWCNPCVAAYGRTRPQDKTPARAAVNNAVRAGKLPSARSVPCVDCGHLGDDRRHEYDHHLGHEPEHWLDVECVCTRCHRSREDSRAGGCAAPVVPIHGERLRTAEVAA